MPVSLPLLHHARHWPGLRSRPVDRPLTGIQAPDIPRNHGRPTFNVFTTSLSREALHLYRTISHSTNRIPPSEVFSPTFEVVHARRNGQISFRCNREKKKKVTKILEGYFWRLIYLYCSLFICLFDCQF